MNRPPEIATEAPQNFPFYWTISCQAAFSRFPLRAGPVAPRIASQAFANSHQGDLSALGRHRLAGLTADIDVCTLPEFGPAT